MHTFEDEFIMTCSTITGLNVDKFNYKSVETIPQVKHRFLQLSLLFILKPNLLNFNKIIKYPLILND